MKRVWKCDFCSRTGNDGDTVARHEDGCTFNPINKTCYTCDNRVRAEYYDSGDECKIHDFGHFLDVEDNGLECDDWKNDKERARKVKKVIEKVNDN